MHAQNLRGSAKIEVDHLQTLLDPLSPAADAMVSCERFKTKESKLYKSFLLCPSAVRLLADRAEKDKADQLDITLLRKIEEVSQKIGETEAGNADVWILKEARGAVTSIAGKGSVKLKEEVQPSIKLVEAYLLSAHTARFECEKETFKLKFDEVLRGILWPESLLLALGCIRLPWPALASHGGPSQAMIRHGWLAVACIAWQ